MLFFPSSDALIFKVIPSALIVCLSSPRISARHFMSRMSGSSNIFLMTLMEIPVHGDIGVEMHPETDQVVRVEEGRALVCMGCTSDELGFRCCLFAGEAVFIPGGIWHNILNAGSCPLKLSSCYAPPQHPHGTIHRTKADGTREGH